MVKGGIKPEMAYSGIKSEMAYTYINVSKRIQKPKCSKITPSSFIDCIPLCKSQFIKITDNFTD